MVEPSGGPLVFLTPELKVLTTQMDPLFIGSTCSYLAPGSHHILCPFAPDIPLNFTLLEVISSQPGLAQLWERSPFIVPRWWDPEQWQPEACSYGAQTAIDKAGQS